MNRPFHAHLPGRGPIDATAADPGEETRWCARSARATGLAAPSVIGAEHERAIFLGTQFSDGPMCLPTPVATVADLAFPIAQAVR